MSDLPLDTEKRLEKVAGGWGREPTPAHPLCVCGKPTGKVSAVVVDDQGKPAPIRGTRATCPVHRPDRP